MGVPTNYTLGKIETYSSGGGYYHAQQSIDLVDYNGYTGPAYLFITIPDYAEELQLIVPDPDEPKIPYLYDDGYLGEFFKEDLKGTSFAKIFIDMLKALDSDYGYTQGVWLDEPITPGGELSIDLSEYIQYLEMYFGFSNWQLRYDFDENGRGIITSDTKYMATMVNADTDAEPEYMVEGFYDEKLRGLDASITTFDFDEAIDYAHTLASSGDYIRLTNELTGEYVTFTADEWMDAIEFGEVPSDVYSIL